MKYSHKNIQDFTDLFIFEMVTNLWKFKLEDNGNFINYFFTKGVDNEVSVYFSKADDGGFNSAIFLLKNKQQTKQLNASTVFFEGFNQIGYIKSEIFHFFNTNNNNNQ